jgi:hypothetical protein
MAVQSAFIAARARPRLERDEDAAMPAASIRPARRTQP